MRRLVGFAVLAAAGSAVAQPEPPRLLPQSITGTLAPVPAQVSPASGITTAPAAPIGRFANLQSFPPETIAAVYSMRSGADWLWRMNQPNGRFFPGLNPAVRQPLDGDTDARQAMAAYALADSARFTGDERYAARTAQTILSLLTATRPDPADPTCRMPTAPPDRCDRVAFAAALVLAIHSLPNPDATLLAQAGSLCVYLRKHCRPTGAIQEADDRPPSDPGLAMQALLAGCRTKPDRATLELVAKAIAFYRAAFHAKPSSALAGSLLPGFVEFALMTGKEPTATAAAFELADYLCDHQYTRTDARNPLWVGGFKAGDAEPGCESVTCAGGLAAAAKLTRQVPDLNRFQKYRHAAVLGLSFARSLQFTDETADHFEKSFRARFLTGGCHLSPSDGTVRNDATAFLVTAQLAYLQSGAE